MSKENAWKLINKKKRRIQEYKSRRFSGPYSIVHEFIVKMDEAVENTSLDLFYMALNDANKLLERRMRNIDPDVHLKIKWNDENKLSSKSEWKDLRVEGVTIGWSKWYLGKHPFSDEEKYIDVAQLFIEGYFED